MYLSFVNVWCAAPNTATTRTTTAVDNKILDRNCKYFSYFVSPICALVTVFTQENHEAMTGDAIMPAIFFMKATTIHLRLITLKVVTILHDSNYIICTQCHWRWRMTVTILLVLNVIADDDWQYLYYTCSTSLQMIRASNYITCTQWHCRWRLSVIIFIFTHSQCRWHLTVKILHVLLVVADDACRWQRGPLAISVFNSYFQRLTSPWNPYYYTK